MEFASGFCRAFAGCSVPRALQALGRFHIQWWMVDVVGDMFYICYSICMFCFCSMRFCVCVRGNVGILASVVSSFDAAGPCNASLGLFVVEMIARKMRCQSQFVVVGLAWL